MIINVVFDSSTTGAPAGFFTAVNAAVQYWEREIVNPITVTIQFGYNEVDGKTIGSSALAESESEGISATYAQVKAGLAAAATTANDQTAVANLPTSDPTNGAGYFVPIAEAEVMGLFGSTSETVGFAGLSSAFPFTFDPNNRSVAGEFDAIGALEHEISEVLGRIAGSGTLQNSVAEFSPLDLFRYASAGVLALTPEAASFSIDGSHLLLPFNNPAGGNDAGDWAPSVTGDSFGEGSKGQAALVSATDLEVMDVLGFTLAANPTARNNYLGHGISDFLIENTGGLVDVGEVVSGAASETQIANFGTLWTIVGSGDFLRHGNSQFLIQTAAGAVDVSEIQGPNVAYAQIANFGTQWKVVGTGDFLNHSDSQFLIENTAGLVDIGEIQGSSVAYAQIANFGAVWKVVGTGDFLGHGDSQYMIENTAGIVDVGEIQGANVAYAQIANFGTQWKVVETGGFLGDGLSQFLIENAAGVVEIGEIQGANVAYAQITGLGTQWTFVGAGDYLGEGHDQFLVENTSGAVDVGDLTNGQLHLTQVATISSQWTFH